MSSELILLKLKKRKKKENMSLLYLHMTVHLTKQIIKVNIFDLTELAFSSSFTLTQLVLHLKTP